MLRDSLNGILLFALLFLLGSSPSLKGQEYTFGAKGSYGLYQIDADPIADNLFSAFGGGVYAEMRLGRGRLDMRYGFEYRKGLKESHEFHAEWKRLVDFQGNTVLEKRKFDWITKIQMVNTFVENKFYIGEDANMFTGGLYGLYGIQLQYLNLQDRIQYHTEAPDHQRYYRMNEEGDILAEYPAHENYFNIGTSGGIGYDLKIGDVFCSIEGGIAVQIGWYYQTFPYLIYEVPVLGVRF